MLRRTMICTSPNKFLDAFERLPTHEMGAQPVGVLVVLDPAFQTGTETADDNQYMDLDSAADPERALAQQIGLIRTLQAIGLPVLTLSPPPGARDAIFPNNVIATVPGRLIIGAMKHANRRLEAERPDLRRYFTGMGYEIVDLSDSGGVAELTGPLIIDRGRRVGLCGMTGRVDEAGCEAMHDAFGLELTFRFDLNPEEYHTNVVLSVLAGRACVMHAGSFADPAVPEALERAYEGATLRLSDEEKLAFAGNCLAVSERDVLISATAKPVLRPESLSFFERHGFELHFVEVDELERAGGSVRCMVCELY